MTQSLRIPKTLMLPNLENIKDPETKKVLEEHNQRFIELINALYSDITGLHSRLEDLE